MVAESATWWHSSELYYLVSYVCVLLQVPAQFTTFKMSGLDGSSDLYSIRVLPNLMVKLSLGRSAHFSTAYRGGGTGST